MTSDSDSSAPGEPGSTASFNFTVWVARGFGVGNAPKAPGTFGTLLGFPLFALMIWPGELSTLIVGCIAATLVSVWFCGEAEKILKLRDPGSIVIDEIIAIPICYLGWAAWLSAGHEAPLSVDYFFVEKWPTLIGIFALFRFFDIVKPWPVKGSQTLRGGWGVTIDDVLAAGYVNLVVLAVLFATGG